MLRIWTINFPWSNLMVCRIGVKYIRIYKLIEPDIFVSVLAFVKCFILTENCFTFNPEVCCFPTRFNVCFRHLYQSGFCCQNDLWFITSGWIVHCDKCCYGFCNTNLLWTSVQIFLNTPSLMYIQTMLISYSF